MPKNSTSKLTGRPQKEINWDTFEQLCKIQCTQSEIASVLCLNVDTVHDRAVKHYKMPYSEIFKRFSEDGKSSLRRAQFKAALGGNVTMLIWLGKIVLGQRDVDIEEANKKTVGVLQNIRELITKQANDNPNAIAEAEDKSFRQRRAV